MGEDRDIKFGGQVTRCMSHSVDDKSPAKGSGKCHAQYVLWPCVRLSVCLSVSVCLCLSQVGILLKQLLLLLLRPFYDPLSRTPQVSRYQKDKPFWILLKQI